MVRHSPTQALSLVTWQSLYDNGWTALDFLLLGLLAIVAGVVGYGARFVYARIVK